MKITAKLIKNIVFSLCVLYVFLSINTTQAATLTNGMEASWVLGQNDFESLEESIDQNGVFFPLSASSDGSNVYIFDAANRVLVFDISAGITNGMNASYVLGQPDFVSNASGTTAGTFQEGDTSRVLVVGTNIYVTDSPNNRVLVFDVSSGITNGMNASYVLGQPDFVSNASGTTAGTFQGPSGLAYDVNNDRLFVSDANNVRVLVFDVSSGITNGMNASYVLGQPDFVSSGVGTTAGLFSEIHTIGYDSVNDYLFVNDLSNNRTTVFDLSAGAPAEEPSSRGYTHPPLCTATITPSTITKGEQATLSWDIQWPTIRKGSFLVKVPGEGLFNSKVQSISINPEYTTTYRISAFNLFGANFCETTVKVIDEAGDEQNPPHLMLSAGAGHSPFANAIKNFFIRLFTR